MISEITVLMTVYNDERYILESIRSILGQSYRNFKFLIINDASTDATVDIINTICDERIKLINLDFNIGQTAALNYGLNLIDTEYVIRMDSDDISMPNRFYELFNCAVSGGYDVVGSNCLEFDNFDNQKLIKKFELSSDIYLNYFAFNTTPFVHGSLIYRYDTLKSLGFYNGKYKICADLDLYKRIYFSSNRLNLFNLQKPLYCIRRHGMQLTKNSLAIEESIDIKVRTSLLLLRKFEIKNFIVSMLNLSYFICLLIRFKLR